MKTLEQIHEIRKSKRFSVSVLSEETNQEVIKTFGYFTSTETNKFEHVKYEEITNIFHPEPIAPLLVIMEHWP